MVTFYSDEGQDAVSEIVKNYIPLVNQKIAAAFVSDSKVISDISHYLFDLGGKKLRPILLLLTASLFRVKTPSEKIISACAAIELVHMATLLHDDIIDKSTTRRGKDSVYKKFGLGASLLAGDFLLVRAFGLSSSTLDEKIVTYTEKACLALTEGEQLEGTITGENWKSLQEYFTIISKKTAALFALSCAAGAHLANANEEQVAIMEEFGKTIGIVFQIIDDILDITAEERNFGKSIGSDLKQKTPSIINILWLESGDNKAKEFFNLEKPTAEDVNSAIQYLRISPFVTEAKKIAEEYANKAKAELNKLTGAVDAQIMQHFIKLLNKTLERGV